MLSLLLYGLLAILAVAVLFAIAVFVLPSGTEVAPAPADQVLVPPLPDSVLSADDVAGLRLPVAWRGYRFAEVDGLLDRMTAELRARDEELTRLRSHATVPTAGGYEPLGYGPPADDVPADDVQADEVQADDVPADEVHAGRAGGGCLMVDVEPEVADRPRCSWANSAPEYIAYHDEEWGTELHGERELFERVSLEAFQSGLSWLIILRKRPSFRLAFRHFDVDAVAAFDASDVERLLGDAGIVRNRSKILATINNALRIRDAVPEGFDDFLWSFAPAEHVRPQALGDVAATSSESVALAKELRKRGFRFVGPTTAYALMQATGMVDDHVAGCWRAG